MPKFKFLPKRKSYNTLNIDNSKQVTQSMTHPSLPDYTNVTSKPENTETETPVKIYSKTIYSFPPSFQHRAFSTFLHMTPVGHHSNLKNKYLQNASLRLNNK